MLMGISSGNQSGNPLDNIYIYDVPIKTSIVVVFSSQPLLITRDQQNPRLGKSKQMKPPSRIKMTKLCPKLRRALETTKQSMVQFLAGLNVS